MAWTTPRTYVTGEVVTAAMLNADHRDNLAHLYDLANGPVCQVRRSTAQAITSSTSFNAISFNTEVEDTHNMWTAGSPTRVTIPTGWSGLYVVTFNAGVEVNANGGRGLRLSLNTSDAAEVVGAPISSLHWFGSISALIRAVAGNYIEAKVLQNSGSTLDVLANTGKSPELRVAFLRP